MQIQLWFQHNQNTNNYAENKVKRNNSIINKGSKKNKYLMKKLE
jgi:hypothetical protein